MRPPTPELRADLRGDVRTGSVLGDVSLHDLALPWVRLWPLWRVAVPLAAGFVLAVACLVVRMNSAHTTTDIRASTQRAREAATAHSQLLLDLEIRSGDDNLRRAALAMGLVPPAHVQHLHAEGDLP